MKKSIIILASGLIYLTSQIARAQEICESLNEPKVEELIDDTCLACEKSAEQLDDELIKEKKSFKKNLPKKIQNSFDQLAEESKTAIKTHEEFIKTQEASIEKNNGVILAAQNKISELSNNSKLTSSEIEKRINEQKDKISTYEKKNENALLKIEGKKKLIDEENRIITNINERSEDLANKLINKECKGLLKRASFSESKVTQGKTEVKKGASTTNNILGEFATEEEAYEFRIGLLNANPHFTTCSVTPHSFKIIKDKPIKMTQQKTLDKISGAGNSFIDNGKGISQTSIEKLDESITNWQDLLAPNQKDHLGREITRKATKIKIYTCASTYRNCSPYKNRSPDEDSCQLLDVLRKYTTSDILKALNRTSESGPIMGIRNQLRKMPKEDQDFLKSVLEAKHFKNALKNVYSEIEEQKNPELKLWIALSSMRAQTMMNKIKQDMGEHVNDSMFEIIPTGHPNDPYNNSKIDPGLSGTCGPLPKTADSFYGKCNKDTKDGDEEVAKCSPQKMLCNKLKKYYGDEDIKQEREELLKSYVGADYLQKPIQEQYKIHRYYQIEPEFEEVVTETTQETVTVQRFKVECKQMKFHCSKIDITPDINLDININFGGTGGSRRNVKINPKRTISCPVF